MIPSDFSPQFCQLVMADIDQMLAIEEAVYAYPWSRGNFSDSFLSAYEAFGLRDAAGQLFAYFIVMPVVDELHLLNIAVNKPFQGRGYARLLLEKLHCYALERQFQSILLEVRRSNARAIDVYHSDGFAEIGLRKGYYPADNQAREDALVMRRMC
ncbi:MAG: ribosomal protein S18-alanine N-acetyltransferase [Burkholderiales bacterium]|nr:ribosomal protein S18-alanine N-acetyltransferase [Burkholderiales bacterium]